jgi:hypothetical protein
MMSANELVVVVALAMSAVFGICATAISVYYFWKLVCASMYAANTFSRKLSLTLLPFLMFSPKFSGQSTKKDVVRFFFSFVAALCFGTINLVCINLLK